MEILHREYMYRCLTLAEAGKGKVAPNPLVGAVLVHGGKVIAEGWHQQFGGPHAEVNCLQAAEAAGYGSKFAECDLYVSLEPCSHFGKTPPCADLIISKKIRRVFIGSADPFPKVNGRGIDKLRQAGIEVIVATGEVMEKCIALNRAFFTFCTKNRPYVVLKWAQTADGFTGSGTKNRLKISNQLTNQLVHSWRSEVVAIMVGTNTAMQDDPLLTNREWPGPSPLRIVIDRQLKLPSSLNLFNDDAPTLVINQMKHDMENFKLHNRKGTSYLQVGAGEDEITRILECCYHLGIQSILVEGGTLLLEAFINAGCWDEARVITNTKMNAFEGVRAPALQQANFVSSMQLESDTITIYHPS